VKRSSTIALVAGILLAGFGLGWLSDLGAARRVEAPTGADPDRAEAKPPPLEIANERPSERTSTDPEPAKPPAELPPEPTGTISGTVVDSRNRPLAGVEVAAVLGVATDVEAFDPETRSRERVAARTRSGADGTFALEVAAGRAHELRGSAPGYALGVVSEVHGGERATLLLKHGAILSGTARRKEGGAPVAGARTFLVPSSGRTVAPVWESRTDEKGGYVAENLPPGAYLFYVFPERLACSVGQVQLSEGESRTLDVSVPTGAIVLGEVKDAETKLPIANAEVSPYGFHLLTVRTDPAGRYELAVQEEEKLAIAVWARAPGYGVYEAAADPGEGGVVRADFELARGCNARGRVVSRERAPVPDADVLARASGGEVGMWRFDRRSARTDRDGRFLLTDLRTDLPHGIAVRKDRFAEGVLRTIEAGIAGEVDLGDLVLAPGGSLEGSVVTASGDGVQAAEVTLTAKDPSRIWGDLFARSATTDAKGVFRFADLAAGDFRFDVQARDLPPRKEGWALTLAEGEAKRDFRVIVGEGRAIGGRVVDARDLAVEGAEIEVTAAASDRPGLVVRSRPDGTFQANGLAPEDYDVEARFRDDYGPPDDRHHLIDAKAARVAAGTTDLVLRLRRAADLAGRVLGLVDDPEIHPFVLAVDGEGRRLAGAHLQPNGRFLLRVPAEEFVELRAWSSAPEAILRGSATSDPEHPPEAVRAGVRGGDADVVLYLKP
jgi:hypothetical protein